jgi:hypothetical protein
MDGHQAGGPPRHGKRFACTRCSARIRELDRRSRRPFRCESGHELALDEIVVEVEVEDLDDALGGLARSLQETTRVMENLAYAYRRGTTGRAAAGVRPVARQRAR